MGMQKSAMFADTFMDMANRLSIENRRLRADNQRLKSVLKEIRNIAYNPEVFEMAAEGIADDR